MYKFPKFIFLLLLITITSKRPSMVKIPLKIIENSFEKYPILRETEFSIEREIEVETPLGPKIRKLKEVISGSIEIINSELFSANINIGSINPQNFTIILDTGSINLWVPGIDSNDAHTIKHHFVPNLSPTAKKMPLTFKVQYGTGYSEGNIYSDNINFISTGYYKIMFGVATKTDFNVIGADGIMGLAKKYNTNDYSSIFTLYNNGVISSKSFSFKYIKGNEAEMYLGEEHSDFSNQNNTAQCQLLHKTGYDNLLWTCKLYKFGFISRDKEINITAPCGYNLLFDTGSNIMILPLETLEHLSNHLKKFNCVKVTSGNGQQILCQINKESLPDVYIEVGNYYLILDHNEMYFRAYVDGILIGYVLNAVFQETSMPLIGQKFFKLFHTKFDPENKVLKFYNEDSNKLIFSSEKPYDDEARTFGKDEGSNIEIMLIIIASLAIVITLLIVFIILYRYYKKQEKTYVAKSNAKSLELNNLSKV